MTHSNATEGLDRLFAPRAVAVVGAGNDTTKPGGRVTAQLLRAGIRVYPVNPGSNTVQGVPCLAAVAELPAEVDVVVVAVGADAAVPIVEACAARKLPFVIVLAGGFAEAGPEGVARQKRLRRALAGTGTRLLGPNTLGVQLPDSGLDTVFVEHEQPGTHARGLAVISQSGSVAIEALRRALPLGLGLHSFIGLGNAVDLAAVDMLRHLADAAERGSGDLPVAVALYLESLGDGRALLAEARRIVAGGIPVLLLKAGRTPGGAAAVSSHTGKMAGVDRILDGAAGQFGIIRVEDDEAMTDAGRLLERAPDPRGHSSPAETRVAVVTPAGGYGVMAVDALEGAASPAGGAGLRRAELSQETRRTLRNVLVPFASTANPVDVTAGVTTEAFVAATAILAAAPEVDLVLVVAFFAPPGIDDALVEHIGAVARSSPTPVVVFTQDGAATPARIRAFADVGVAAFPSLTRAVRAAAVLARVRAAVPEAPAEAQAARRPEPDASGDTDASGVAARSRRRGRAHPHPEHLPAQPTEAQAKELLLSYGLAVPASMVLAADADAQVSFTSESVSSGGSAAVPSTSVPSTSVPPAAAPSPAGRPRPPYALKVLSPRLQHKTDAGALRLGVPPEDLSAGVAELRAEFPGCDILVEEMCRGELELIAGAVRDPDLGPALMLGAGGIYTEVYRDVSFRLLPCSTADIRAMIEELKIATVLKGSRGIHADLDGLVAALAGISELVMDLGDRFTELDVNPLVYVADRRSAGGARGAGSARGARGAWGARGAADTGSDSDAEASAIHLADTGGWVALDAVLILDGAGDGAGA